MIYAMADKMLEISIRALLAEGDFPSVIQHCVRSDFNPRPPCGGRPGLFGRYHDIAYFNPRPPCGGRQGPGHGDSAVSHISIRALLAEGDYCTDNALYEVGEFQSAPSLRRATGTD